MDQRFPKKLGILLSIGADHPNFNHGLQLAAAALNAQNEVYLYCLDESVRAVTDERLQTLKSHGLRLFACSFASKQRGLPETESAIYGGLTMLSDVMASADRLVSFN